MLDILSDTDVYSIAHSKCRSSLLYHTRYFFKAQYNRKFVIGNHHKLICSALERVLSGELKRLIINMPPRYGKTELAVKAFISHGLAVNSSAKFIHLSGADTLALDNSEAVKDLIQSDEYQALFPNVQIKKDSKSKDKWYTTKNGGVLARAAGGQVTGFGAGSVDDEDEFGRWLNDIEEQSSDRLDKQSKFGGAIVIDDPIKPEEADSDTARERVNERFDSTIRTRVNSRNTPIILIMQRLHPNDLSGYLMRDAEADKWEVISLPAVQIVDGQRKALWEFKHTLSELDKLKEANDVVFERQYMQNPNPKEGLMFPIQSLNWYDPEEMEMLLADPDYCYMAVDPSGAGGGLDDFAGVVCKLIGDKIYITEVIYNNEGADINEARIVEVALKNRPASVGIEGVMGFVETAMRVRTELNEKNYQGEVRVLRPRTGKHARIMNRASFVRNNFVFRKDYKDYPQYFKYIRNITSYLKIQEAGKTNKTDDAVDVNEMAGAHFEQNFPHLW